LHFSVSQQGNASFRSAARLFAAEIERCHLPKLADCVLELSQLPKIGIARYTQRNSHHKVVIDLVRGFQRRRVARIARARPEIKNRTLILHAQIDTWLASLPPFPCGTLFVCINIQVTFYHNHNHDLLLVFAQIISFKKLLYVRNHVDCITSGHLLS
jgi:hypothetical protein